MVTGWCDWCSGDLKLHLKVQPKARRDGFVGILSGNDGEVLKVSIVAPPVDGKANQYLLKFLAKSFGVSRQQAQLLRGESCQHKTVLIQRPLKVPTALSEWGVRAP